jgi:hypothetical protein
MSHLTIALIAPLARLDDQSLHFAVEKRVDHATEALGARNIPAVRSSKSWPTGQLAIGPCGQPLLVHNIRADAFGRALTWPRSTHGA